MNYFFIFLLLTPVKAEKTYIGEALAHCIEGELFAEYVLKVDKKSYNTRVRLSNEDGEPVKCLYVPRNIES